MTRFKDGKTDNSARSFGLSERDLATIGKILAAFPMVTDVRIFGSRAKGTYHLGSDIDLAVMDAGLDELTLACLSGAFEESSLPYRVDVIYYPELAHAELLEHINRVGKGLYRAK